MRMAGLEPARSHLRKILSRVRLPFRHIRSRFVLTPNRDLYYHMIFTFAIVFLQFFQIFSKNIKFVDFIYPMLHDTLHKPHL